MFFGEATAADPEEVAALIWDGFERDGGKKA